jgi:hypothetical protein
MGQADTAEQVERGARTSSTLEWAVRAGLLGYGLVHLLVAWVALRLVFGGGSGSATGQGALAQLAGDTAGKATLLAMAAGFAALAGWQLVTGLVGYRDQEGLRRHLMRAGAGCRVAVYAYFAGASARLALAGHSASGGSPDSLTAKVMAAPAGPFLVGAVGLTAAGIGIGLVVFGVRKGFLGQLDRKARTSQRRAPIVVLGQVGYVVKGVAFVVIGVLLCWAGATHDPHKSGGLDEALHELLGGSLGGPAVVVVGLGIGCFGLYLFARSWHLDDESLTS